MLSTISLVVAGLSSGHKLGLAVVGTAFIVFALISSFVVPRRNPNFPGKNMGWYVAACALFFLAMISAVLIFGKEAKETTPGESPAATTDRSGSLPGQTASTPTTTAAKRASGGDATAGKAVFASAGCGGCHTLKDAGSSGNVGPNLDDLKPTQDVVAHQVEVGGGAMPPFKDQLSPKQIADVAAYVSSSAGS